MRCHRQLRGRGEKPTPGSLLHRARGLCGHCFRKSTQDGTLDQYASSPKQRSMLRVAQLHYEWTEDEGIDNNTVAARLGMKNADLHSHLSRFRKRVPKVCASGHEMIPPNVGEKQFGSRKQIVYSCLTCEGQLVNTSQRRIAKALQERLPKPDDEWWRDRAECQGSEQDFVPSDPINAHVKKLVHEYCDICPVWRDCLLDELKSNDPQGIRGGKLLPRDMPRNVNLMTDEDLEEWIGLGRPDYQTG